MADQPATAPADPTADTAEPPTLRTNPDWLKVWTGETISLIGTQVTQLALPLVAILTLQATAFEIGVLNASRYLPVVVVSLFAGVWLDRRRRRPVLIASNLGRAVLIGLIPVSAQLGLLTIPLLCVLCVLIGTLTVVFDVGLLSYVPNLVHRRRLTEANGKLQTSWSLAGIIGPGLGGLLVGLVTAPVALVVDAVSFLASAALMVLVRTREPEVEAAADRPSLRTSIAEGLSTVFGNRVLRALLTQSGTFNMFQNALLTVFLVYGVRWLGLTPAQLGVVVGAMSVGGLAGAFLAHRFTNAVGLGRMLRITTCVVAVVPLVMAVPTGSGALTVGVLMAAQAVYGFFLVVYNVNTMTLRQIVTPNRLLARMNASYRLVLFGTIPIGALLGGTLAQTLGLRAAMIITVVLLVSPVLWTFFSPVYALRRMPTGPDDLDAALGRTPEPATTAATPDVSERTSS